jgi:hypothetical protein
MEWHALLIDGYGRALEAMERTLDGLTPVDMDERPSDDTNPIGWLAWHLTRLQDHHVSALMGESQLYISEGWHARFDRPADTEDVGFGHTNEQVAAFRSPEQETFLAYHRAVLARTEGYLRGLSPADLDRELNEPWYQPLPTVGVRLISVLADELQHAGQMGYVRGLLKGKGWQKF